MNKNLADAKEIARTHIPHIIAAASVVTTAGVCLYFNQKYSTRMLLEVTPAQLLKMAMDGGRCVFPNVHGLSLALTVIDPNE